MSKRSIPDFKRKTAQRLRAGSTEAETVLWRRLRHLKIEGSHFRRQVVIGPYIADFACLATQLIIEVDGSQHGDAGKQRRDEARAAWLESEGYRIVRFWNNDVLRDTEAVMTAIYELVSNSHPTPRA